MRMSLLPLRVRTITKCIPIFIAVVLIIWSRIAVYSSRSNPLYAVYGDEYVSQCIRSAVLDGNSKADSSLAAAMELLEPGWKNPREQEFRKFVMGALNTKDNCCWKPYITIRTNMPAYIAKWLPEWREPKKVRLAAASWLCDRAVSDFKQIAKPSEVISEVQRKDPDGTVRRMMIIALFTYGIVSETDSPVMLKDLSNPNPAIRIPALRWFTRAKTCPEAVVPILVHGLQDESNRSDYAQALMAYGPQASFAIPWLISLTKSNDRSTAGTAAWALESIDPKTARRLREVKFY